MLGGYHHPTYMKSCEKLSSNGNWENIQSLNYGADWISAIFIYPHFIYVIGGSIPYQKPGAIERLNVKGNTPWDILQTSKGNTTNRLNCMVFQFCDNQILIGGGENIGFLEILNISTLKFETQIQKFNSYIYYGSKTRVKQKEIHIISSLNFNNKRIKIDFSNLQISEVNIDF